MIKVVEYEPLNSEIVNSNPGQARNGHNLLGSVPTIVTVLSWDLINMTSMKLSDIG